MKMAAFGICWINGIRNLILSLSLLLHVFNQHTKVLFECYPSFYTPLFTGSLVHFWTDWVLELYYLHLATVCLLYHGLAPVSFQSLFLVSPLLLKPLVSFQVLKCTKFFPPFLFPLLRMLVPMFTLWGRLTSGLDLNMTSLKKPLMNSKINFFFQSLLDRWVNEMDKVSYTHYFWSLL